MLKSITLRNFKCFRQQKIPLQKLTVLSGLNCSGKSTVLQAILLIKQSHMQHSLQNGFLRLNGPLVNLGNAGEVLHTSAEQDSISFILESTNNTWKRECIYEDASDDSIKTSKMDTEDEDFTIFCNGFTYLSAERLGPRIVYKQSSYDVRHQRQMGSDGRFAAHYLGEYSKQKILPEMHHSDSKSDDLISEVEAWLGEISPGVIIEAQILDSIHSAVVQFGFAPNPVEKEYFNPMNMGFGLSYVLPVFVGILSAKPSDLVIIENPEAHLHPKGQMKIGQLFVQAASAGVQVIIETHSDHILNGIRVSTKKELIDPSDIAIHFFSRKCIQEKLHYKIKTLELDKNGRFNEWPDDFFDQWEKSLDQLLD